MLLSFSPPTNSLFTSGPKRLQPPNSKTTKNKSTFLKKFQVVLGQVCYVFRVATFKFMTKSLKVNFY